MDLRNQASHLHYIHVIKKGTVVELMNQSPFGVPARKFRDLEDIYNDDDSLCDITLSGNKLGSSATVDDCSKEGMRILISSAGASLWKDPFGDEAACDSHMNDSISDELTLKHILEKCKKKRKKRKTPESGFGNETSTTGKEHSASQVDDDLSDLILPLSYLVPNIRNKRRVKVVENPDFLSQSQNTLGDFDKNEEASLGKCHPQQIESTTQHINLASTSLQPSCSNNEDDNSDCSIYSLNHLHSNPTTVDLSCETADSSQGSRMMGEEYAGRLLQNQQSRSDCLTTYFPCMLTVHNETENQKSPDGDFQSLKQGYLYDLPVAELSSQNDDSAKPLSDVSMNAVSPSIDLVSEKIDRSQLQSLTDEIIYEAGNDPVKFPCTMPEVVCESVQQLSQSSLIVLEENVSERVYVTPLPDACLHALSKSVNHVSDKHSNSETCCIGNELDSPAAENIVLAGHDNEPCCTENEMDSLVVENLVETDILLDRFTINKENENLPSFEGVCQSFRTGLSHLPVSEVNVQEDTSTITAPLLDVPSDALTSPANQTSNNNIPMDLHNNYHMNCVAQLNPVNQQIDARLVASPACNVKTMGEHLHMVKETIEDAMISSPRDSLITNSTEGISVSASSTSSFYSDSGVPTNHTARDDELLFAKSCSVTETCNHISTGSCGPLGLDKPLAPERIFLERKDSSPGFPNELWKAMENIDTLDSREKLRSLGRLVSDNQFKLKKRPMVKGVEIKGSAQLFKTDMSKHSESKKNGRDKKWGQCIPSSPEGAILFSKKQMQDFEALAKKLTRELASMKEIVEERLNNEAGTTGNVNDQVITAINKASKAEQTVKKRLSSMNRDCIRFCTIMKISENNTKETANSETTAQKKEGKRIKFADEAGGQLCQIKFIETGEVSSPSSV